MSRHLVCWLFFAVIALAGCGNGPEGESSPDAGISTDGGETACPSAEVLEQEPACQLDDDCPCGTHCSLGRCIARCTTDNDCSIGEQCDDFGRCRAEGDRALVPLPSTDGQGTLTVDRQQLFLTADAEQAIQVGASDRPVTQARVVAERGVEIQCPQQEGFSAKCMLEDLQVDSKTDLIVRYAESYDETSDDIPTVTLYGPANTETVSIPRFDQTVFQVDPVPEPIAGSYRGTLRLDAVGTTDTLENMPDAPIPTEFAVDATIWSVDGGIVLGIDDPNSALTSRGEFIGTLELGEANEDDIIEGTGTFKDHPFASATVAGQDHTLLASTVEANLRATEIPRAFSLELTQAYRGMGLSRTPAVRWVIELERTGTSAATLPNRSDLPAELDYDPQARALEASPWAAAFQNNPRPSIDSITGDFLDPQQSRYCGMSASVMTRLEQELGAYWMLRESKVVGSQPLEFPYSANFMPVYENAVDLATAAYQQVDPNVTSGAFYNLDTPDSFSEVLRSQNVRGVACSFRDFRVTLAGYAGQAVPAVTTGGTAIDFCNTLANDLDCRVQDADIPVSYYAQGGVTWEGNGVYPLRNAFFDINTTVDKTCVLPTSHARCAESISCIDSTSTATDDYRDWGFGSSFTDESGDFMCDRGSLSAGIALDRGPTDRKANEVLDLCKDDLEGLAAAPPTGGSPNAVFGDSNECISYGRLLAAVGTQSPIFNDGFTSTSPEAEAAAAAYTQRLLVRWLKVHGYIAMETDQTEQMAEYFRRGLNQTASDQVPPRIETMFPASMKGWDIFLTPHVARAVLEMPDEAVAQPDYRVYGAGREGATGEDPRDALGPVIFETLIRHASLLERYLKTNGRTRGSDTDYITEWMPRMLLAQTLAADLNRRAQATDTTPSWADSYVNQRERAKASILDSLDYILTVNNGGNPLGVEDYDLPLYYAANDSDGDVDRFTAITNYIAGTEDGPGGLAKSAISTARTSLRDAELVYEAASERNWRTGLIDQFETLSDQWKIDLKRKYNNKLFDICGPNLEAGNPDYSPIDDPNFNAASCAVADTQECTLTAEEQYGDWTEDDFLGRICMHNVMSWGYNSTTGFTNERARTFASTCYNRWSNLPTDNVLSVEECSQYDSDLCLKCDWKDNVLELPLTRDAFHLAPANAPTSGREGRASNRVARARRTCRQRHPNMRRSVSPERTPIEIPDCLTGSLGESYLNVVSATTDIKAAQQAYDEHLDAYKIAMRSCFSLASTNRQLSRARSRHERQMRGLRNRKFEFDRSAQIATATKECLDAASGADGIAGAIGAVGTCAAAVAEADYTVKSMFVEAYMEKAQLAHDNEIANIAESGEERRCFIEARKELVGMETASTDIESALYALERAHADVDGQIMEAERLHARGRAHVEELADEPEMVDGEQWAQPEIEQYIQDFTLAKRATYLAVRAAEYEFQQSLSVRQLVLTAKLPQDLEDALAEVWTTAKTRSIGGKVANELTAVVSLRDDILQLNDMSQWPESFHTLSVEERFRALLSAERYAVYDDSGQYVGQRIPFELAPLGSLGAETNGVAIYSRTDCAERLWSIDAGIVGDGAAVGGSQKVRMDVSQRNAFYSQWCGDPSSYADPFQYASVRPSRNLFRVPGSGQLEGTEASSDPDEVQEFTRARLQATIGTDEATLEDESASVDASSELATRGLYGDYAIFIDDENISRNGEDGLDLNAVEDILLRFDYLSVSK